jgi:membrane associated rhomboid family serine protease
LIRAPRTATACIIIVTSAVWLLTVLIGAADRAAIVMGFIPARFGGLIDITPAVPAWLTPLTATLVHGGALHLGLNMVMMGWCGSKVERALGSGSLITLYIAGAYVAAIAQWFANPLSPTPMIGASGAISAVIGAFALSFGQQKRIVSSASINRTLNALWLLAAWVVLQLMSGYLAGGQGYLLATPAHIGGFIAGLALQRPLLIWRYRKA